jgi:hypothetical protein
MESDMLRESAKKLEVTGSEAAVLEEKTLGSGSCAMSSFVS